MHHPTAWSGCGPITWRRSQGHLTSNRNGNKGMPGLRAVHRSSAWGPSFYKGKWRSQQCQPYPEYCYGAVQGRSREEAIGAQQISTGRLLARGFSVERDYWDVANAYGSSTFDAHSAALDHRIVHATHFSSLCVLKQGFEDSFFTFQTNGGALDVRFQVGGMAGINIATDLFNSTYVRVVEPWRLACTQLSSVQHLQVPSVVDPDKISDLSLRTFVDDLSHVFAFHQGSQRVRDTQATQVGLVRSLAEVGIGLNNDKKEVLLKYVGKGAYTLQRQYFASKQGVRDVRHLGPRMHYALSFYPEPILRIRSCRHN